MKNKYKICALIVTYNCGEDVYNTIDSVISKVEELIIVDNGSEKETIEALNKYRELSNVKVLLNKVNLGIAKALNVGVCYAREKGYEWILTLDDDSIVTESMIDIMIKAYDSLGEVESERIAILAPKHIEKAVSFNNQIGDENNLTITRVNTEITSGNLVKLEVLKEIGMYKEEYFIDFVDHYLCLALRRKGYEIVRIEEAILLHSLGVSDPKIILGKAITVTNHSPVRRYYMTRNRLSMWKEFNKEFPAWVKEDKGRFINEAIKIVLYEEQKYKKLRMIAKGIKDYKKGKYGPI
jgi:rhamnosyltransferase